MPPKENVTPAVMKTFFVLLMIGFGLRTVAEPLRPDRQQGLELRQHPLHTEGRRARRRERRALVYAQHERGNPWLLERVREQ